MLPALTLRRKYVRIGFRQSSCSLLLAEMSTAMKLSSLVRNPAGASIVVVTLVVSDRKRVLPVGLSVLEPQSVVALRRLRHVGRTRGVFERQSIAVEPWRDDRIHRGEVRREDLVAAFDHDIGEQLFNRRIAELAGVNNRSDHLVGEGSNARCGPEGPNSKREVSRCSP